MSFKARNFSMLTLRKQKAYAKETFRFRSFNVKLNYTEIKFNNFKRRAKRPS